MHTIDTHSHFNLHQFEHDRDESITRMQRAGVGTICVGIDGPTSEHAVALAEQYEGVWACVGQHPTEWEKPYDHSFFEGLVTQEKVVAVGECGIDYYREEDRKRSAIQKELFQKQIELAHTHNLPLMLHIRPEEGTMTAYEEALDMLEEYQAQPHVAGALRGTAHFFVGTKEIAKRFLDLGFYISFSGVITFVKEYESLVDFVPLDRILSETDAPFATPAPHRGKRNNPEYVVEVVKKIAEIKKLPFEAVKTQLLENAKTLFVI